MNNVLNILINMSVKSLYLGGITITRKFKFQFNVVWQMFRMCIMEYTPYGIFHRKDLKCEMKRGNHNISYFILASSPSSCIISFERSSLLFKRIIYDRSNIRHQLKISYSYNLDLSQTRIIDRNQPGNHR